MEVIVAEMATTPMSVGIYESLSEPRNATELQYRILSKGCYSRSEGVLEMRQCPLYRYWWGKVKKCVLGCHMKQITTTDCCCQDCLLSLGRVDRACKETGSSYPCLLPLSCALVPSIGMILQETHWQKRNKVFQVLVPAS